MKGKGRKEIKTVGRGKQGKKTKGKRKKNIMKKKDEKKKYRRRGFEPETIRLGTCSLNDYTTHHLTLSACNC